MPDSQSRLTCLPHGICSWQFRLRGAQLQAETHLDVFTEQGSITIGSSHFAVHKDGMLSGRWTLLAGAEPVYAAKKVTPFHRTLVVDGPHKGELRACSAFGRAMELECGNHHATLAPAHPFTRRASIVGTWPDDRLVVFAFWLTTLVWRRKARDA